MEIAWIIGRFASLRPWKPSEHAGARLQTDPSVPMSAWQLVNASCYVPSSERPGRGATRGRRHSRHAAGWPPCMATMAPLGALLSVECVDPNEHISAGGIAVGVILQSPPCSG